MAKTIIGTLEIDSANEVGQVLTNNGSGVPPTFQTFPQPLNNNLLINGAFSNNQINSGSPTVVNSGDYFINKWYGLTQTSFVTFSAQTLQQDGIATNCRFQQSQGAAQMMGMAQIVEARDSRWYRGSQLTLSFQSRCSIPKPLRYAILEWDGTIDVPPKNLVNDWTSTTYTPGNFFSSSFTVIATGSFNNKTTWNPVTPITGVASSSLQNLIVFIWTEVVVDLNYTLDVSNCKLEYGATSTDYFNDSSAILAEKCARFTKLVSVGASGIAASTTTVAFNTVFNTMAITPTPVLEVSAVNFQIPGGISQTSSGSSITSNVLSTRGASIVIDGYIALVPGTSGYSATAGFIRMNGELGV